MKCRQARKMLSPYIDDELSDEERASLEEHLGSCEACRSELETLRQISQGLKEIYQQVKAPPNFVDSVMKRIQELEEGKGSYLLHNNPPVYQNRWLRVALAAAVAAGVGLGALQYGRTQGGVPTAWSGSYKATPGTEALAEKDKEGSPGTKVSAFEKVQTPDKGGSISPVEQAPAKDEPWASGVEKEKTAQERAPTAVEEGKSENTAVGEGTGEQGKTDMRVATGEEKGTYEPKVFLSRTRHVRTTMVKVEVEDLASAKAAVAAGAAKAGNAAVSELWVYQDKEIILKAVIPSGAAGEFLDRVASLGNVLERRQETSDITAEFNNKVLEYQVLAGKKDEESQVMAKALERYLGELDGQTLEVGKEVVNVWLKLR